MSAIKPGGGSSGGVADGSVTLAKLAADVTASALGGATRPASVATTHTLSGAVYDYTTDTQWAPSGVTLGRSDTGRMTRNTLPFWCRGTSRTAGLAGNANGLRALVAATSESAGNQPLPYLDAAFSVFTPLGDIGVANELEVDFSFVIGITQKAATGSVNFRMGLLGMLAGSIYALNHAAYYSFVSANSGNLTREIGLGTTTSSPTQMTTSTTLTRTIRMRRRGPIFETWDGADANSLSRLSALTSYAHATTPLVFTFGASNNDHAANAGSYIEARSITVRGTWS